MKQNFLPTAANWCLVLVAVCLPAVVESSRAAEGPADPLAQSRAIDEELRKLNETPAGLEISAMNQKFRTVSEQADKARQEVDAQYSKFRETEAYRDFQKQWQALSAKRESEWARERKVMAEAAQKLYSTRHEELKQFAGKTTPGARRLGFDVFTYPRLDGSTSTHPLSVIIASRVLGTPYEWIYPEPTGSPWSRAVMPENLFLFGGMPGIYDPYPRGQSAEFALAASRVVAKPANAGQDRLAIMINSLLAINSATHDAYTNLVEGRCDLNLTARAPSEDELALAVKKGVKIELRPIAKDALVFIVNQQTPVKNLGRSQLLDIYQGKIKSWAGVGGAATNLVALWRERNSGSRELFEALVANGQKLPDPVRRADLFVNGMGGPYSRVTSEPWNLGYSVYYYEHYMALSAYTRVISVDGIEPTAETIRSGKYPLTCEVYVAYLAGQPAASPTMKLLAWLVSSEGQSVIRESGYVPVK